MSYKKSAALVAVMVLLSVSALAQESSDPSFGDRFKSGQTSAESQRAQKEATIPRCAEPVGSVTIIPPERNWWDQSKLQSPDKLIQMFVARSGCFTIVDRGRGFEIAERERALAGSGTLQQGSNIGGGQTRAADYVITPDVVVSSSNSGGNALGAILGAIIPGFGGAIVGSLRMTDQSANVTLAVTNVRTSEQIIMAEGRAQKTDIGFGVGGGAFMGGGFGAAGVSSYENTPLGQVVAMAYLDAYTQMVARIQNLRGVEHRPANPPPIVERPAVQAQEQSQPAVTARVRPVATAREGTFYRGPSEKSAKIRDVPPGTIFYPTTNTSGFWWEVVDDEGERGWIPARILQLGQ